MTKNPPPVRYCYKHGCLLIRRHFIIARQDGQGPATGLVIERDVPPRCIYESEGCVRQR